MLRVKGSAPNTDLTLSVGRMVARQTRAVDRYIDHTGRTILLVHGYNVDESDAVVALGAFQSFLSELHAPLARDTFTVSWPGKRKLGFADYPWTTQQARVAALTLLKAIRRRCKRDPAADLVIVAHSLGCRMVLEALQRLSHFPTRPRNLVLVLMAAAVPVDMVERRGTLHGGVAIADLVAVLHSQKDWVLAGPFRLGQTLAGEGRFPVAVGSEGEPFAPAQRHNLSPAGHGGYWKSRKAAQILCRICGVPAAAAALDDPLPVAPSLPFGPSRTADRLRFQ